jgi:hypothetical protein
MSDPWIAAAVILATAAYIWAFIYTGGTPAQKRAGLEAVNPEKELANSDDASTLEQLRRPPFGETILNRIAELGAPDEWVQNAIRQPSSARFESDEQRFGRQWDQLYAEEAGQPLRMSFSELVQRVAYLSRWGDQYEGQSYEYVAEYLEDPWKLLKKEICRPLTMDDVAAWGIKHERSREPENGPTKIDADFWRRADFAPELMLTEPSIGSAGNGELGIIYSDIVFARAAAEHAWPLALRGGTPSPFRSIYTEWRAEWDKQHREHAEWLNRPHPATQDPVDGREKDEKAARRHALIAKGRDIVARFRAERPSETFETFARRQRGFFDIQSHLGPEYQQWVTRNAERDVSAIADGEFLRELVRLEEEWGLI